MNKLFVALLMFASLAGAQVPSSVLSGRVADPSGRPVPSASVSLHSLGTDLARTQETGTDGLFRFGGLPPGNYRLAVEHRGFASYLVGRIQLRVRETVELEVRLTLAARAERISVTEVPVLVEAAVSPEGWTAAQEQIDGLPLEQRNFAGLATLGPGVVPRHLGGFVHDVVSDVQPARGELALNPPVNGVRGTANTFLLDGVLNTDGNTNAVVVNPPIHAVQEFRLQTSFSPAEFGYSGGGVVNMISRQGSEQLHAGAFEYLRNEALDARNYFDPAGSSKAAFRQHQFGAQAGGRVPRARGLFFFGAYEGLRLDQGRASASTVPDAALRSGDFSAAGTIYDPRTLDPVTGNRQPFANNRIPAGRIDPIARGVLDKFEPLPNTSGANNFLDSAPDARTNDSTTGRMDWQYSSRATLFARYSLNSERANQGHDLLLQPSLERVRAQQLAIGHTYAASAAVNEVRLGFNRLRVLELPRNAYTRDVAGELNVGGIDRDPVNYGLPTFILGNFMMASDDPTLPLTQRDQTFQGLDSFSLRRGRHTIQAGGEFRRFEMNYQQRLNSRGRFTFTGAYTGDPFGDFLLGLPQMTERTAGQPQAYLRRLGYAAYLQDDVRLEPRVILTLGVRYDYHSPFSDKRGNLFNLDYSTLPAAPVLVQQGTAAFDRGFINRQRRDFAPRIGLGWTPGRGHLVFRAAYGIYYSPEIAAETYNLVRNGVRVEQNRASGNDPILTLANGFPSGANSGFRSYFGLDPRARTPYVQHWNATWQAGARGFAFEAAYIGTRGTHLGRFRNFNTPQHVETGENLSPRDGDIQSLRTFPSLGKIVQVQHISNSIYHSLQLRAERRMARGLRLQASFTWAKAIDDADSILPGLFDSVGAQDERNLRLERGLSFFDVRRRIAFNFVWDLPFGHARRFLASSPVCRLVSGWTVSGTGLLQDGTPLNPVYFGFQPANSDTFNRPNVVPGQNIALPRGERTPEHFFNTAAFSDPAPLTFGNAGRNIIPGPGNNVFNFAIQRSFSLRESRRLDFRAELFNAFNHPNFGIPGPYADFGPFFGKVFSVGDPRRIQLGVRFNF